MDLDLGSLWSWTLPLWSLIILIFFLVGVQTQEVVLPVHIGGYLTGSRSSTKTRSIDREWH
jgi:hypothetical protein